MGFIDFDGARYWDIRDAEIIHAKPRDEDVVPDSLPSDSIHRTDRIFLAERPIGEA